MANENSVIPYIGATVKELAEALGVTQFPSETSWYQVLGGIVLQGGKVTAAGSGATVNVPFNVGFPLQCLGVFIQAVGATVVGGNVHNVTLEDFDIVNGAAVQDFYWWALGV